MKTPILPILIVLLILGGAYYYLFVMKKQETSKDEEKTDEKPKQETILGQPAPDHSSEAIANLFSGEDWRKKHPILI